MFSESKGAEGGGEVFATRDGRARLHMFSMENPKRIRVGTSCATISLVKIDPLTYDRVAHNFFAVSTRREGMIVYLRCNFSSARGGTLHCADIRYPVNEKRDWDAIVTRISRSVRPLPSQ